MTQRQKLLVQTTYEQIVPYSEEVAALFYGRLFELDPTVRPLFRGDMTEQGRKLVQMLTVAVRGIDRLDQIIPAVQDLGRRHLHYGVKVEHYQTVGEALLWALEQRLQGEFTPEVREAWATVYDLLAGTMKGAAAVAA